MFLPKVYKHNKWLFIAMVLFIIAQLFINFKRGMVVSPFFHYGMYSEVMNVKQGYDVFEVEVNYHKLQAKNFSPQQWDKIIQPLVYYASINKSNELYFTDIKRLMSSIHLSAAENDFLQSCDTNRFVNWYRAYLQTMLNQKINSIEIQSRLYQFHSGHLQPTNSTVALSQACN